MKNLSTPEIAKNRFNFNNIASLLVSFGLGLTGSSQLNTQTSQLPNVNPEIRLVAESCSGVYNQGCDRRDFQPTQQSISI